MRAILVGLIILPVAIFCAVLGWIASSQPKAAEAAAVVPSIGEPPKSEDPKVQKGWEVYTTKGCVYCHGPNAEGGVSHRNSMGGKIPPLNKVYEGFSVEELKTKIKTGVADVQKEDAKGPMPPLYMPAWEKHLTEEELEAVTAYLFNFKPAGGGGEEW